VTVHPDHQGRGIGRVLLDGVAGWARERANTAMTLTTYRDVAWNRPLYEHLGWFVLADHDIGPARVCMRRELIP
jgi:GNAT superfamily N-acetyltransferase